MSESNAATADTALDALLRPRGSMNFNASCACDGGPARLAMNAERVFLAVASGTGRVVSDTFSNITSSGNGRTRTVRFGAASEMVTFLDEQSAARFDRVLDVRQGSFPTSSVPAPGESNTAYASATPVAGGGTWQPDEKDLASAFEQNARYTMTASALLIAVGWFNAALGLILALVLAVVGNPIGILWGLLLAVAGSALPLCVGYLARTIIYRYQWQDQQSRR